MKKTFLPALAAALSAAALLVFCGKDGTQSNPDISAGIGSDVTGITPPPPAADPPPTKDVVGDGDMELAGGHADTQRIVITPHEPPIVPLIAPPDTQRIVIIENWPRIIPRETCQPPVATAAELPRIAMVFVKGGTFSMGCTSEQGDDCWERDEKPVHKVTLSDFYIAKYQVTQKLWTAVMGCNPSRFKGDDNRPVETVRREEAQVFIDRLNGLTGKNYRLLTEAEWEYAARGGRFSRGYKYAGSNDADKVAWFGVNTGGTTHPVGLKAPNELGLYDMSGNVYEWVSGYRSSLGYCAEPQVNPAVSSCGVELPIPGRPIYDCSDPSRPCLPSYHERPWTGPDRPMMRGGGWQISMESELNCRVSRRYSPPPTFTNDDIGLRLAHSPCPKFKHTEGF